MKSKNLIFVILGVRKHDYPLTEEKLMNLLELRIKKIEKVLKYNEPSEKITRGRLELIKLLKEKVEEYVKPANLAIINQEKSLVMDVYNASKSDENNIQSKNFKDSYNSSNNIENIKISDKINILELTAKIVKYKEKELNKEKLNKNDFQNIMFTAQNEFKTFRNSLLNEENNPENTKTLIFLDQMISDLEKLKVFYLDTFNFEIFNKIKNNLNENLHENTHYEPTFKLERTSVKEIKSIEDVMPKGILEEVLTMINGKNLDFFVCENDKNFIYNSKGEVAAKKDMILTDGNISFEKKGVVEIGAVAGIVKHYIGKYEISHSNFADDNIHKEHTSIYGIINFSKYREDEKYRAYVLTRILDARAKEEINIGEITEEYKSIYTIENVTKSSLEKRSSLKDKKNKGSERDYV